MISSNEPGETPVSMKVVQRVAAATGQRVTQLPPLHDAIDPEALDSLTESVAPHSSSLETRFTYAGQRVRIDGSGAVSVEN